VLPESLRAGVDARVSMVKGDLAGYDSKSQSLWLLVMALLISFA
jgi:hypothetical protein